MVGVSINFDLSIWSKHTFWYATCYYIVNIINFYFAEYYYLIGVPLFISIHKTPLQVSIFVRCAMCVLCVYVGGCMNECVSFSLCPNEWTNKTWLNFTRCVQKREQKNCISNVFYSTYELIIVSRRWRCDFQQSRSMFRLCHLFMLFSYYNLIVIISSIERWQSGWQANKYRLKS